MLVKLLKLVAGARGVVTVPEMARELGVGRGLVDAMIADAARLGYLTQMKRSCGQQLCSDCIVHGSCNSSAPSGYWLLTDKGARLLGKS